MFFLNHGFCFCNFCWNTIKGLNLRLYIFLSTIKLFSRSVLCILKTHRTLVKTAPTIQILFARRTQSVAIGVSHKYIFKFCICQGAFGGVLERGSRSSMREGDSIQSIFNPRRPRTPSVVVTTEDGEAAPIPSTPVTNGPFTSIQKHPRQQDSTEQGYCCLFYFVSFELLSGIHFAASTRLSILRVKNHYFSAPSEPDTSNAILPVIKHSSVWGKCKKFSDSCISVTARKVSVQKNIFS